MKFYGNAYFPTEESDFFIIHSENKLNIVDYQFLVWTDMNWACCNWVTYGYTISFNLPSEKFLVKSVDFANALGLKNEIIEWEEALKWSQECKKRYDYKLIPNCFIAIPKWKTYIKGGFLELEILIKGYHIYLFLTEKLNADISSIITFIFLNLDRLDESKYKIMT